MSISDLMPCPFCGRGSYRLDPQTYWTGQRSIVQHVKLRHWCEREEGVPRNVIILHGKTEDDVKGKWDRWVDRAGL